MGKPEFDPDSLCECGHVYDEHSGRGCEIEGCACCHFDVLVP